MSNYLSNQSKGFFELEDDVDDDLFLKNSRRPAQQSTPQYSTSSNLSYEEQRLQQLQAQKKEIERRTIQSSERSMGLLYESEKVGNSAAEELYRQKEQLKLTEGRLDDINSSLKQSERHIDGIKSIFGGIRNYFYKRNNPQQSNAATFTNSSSGTSGMAATSNIYPDSTHGAGGVHPGLRKLDQLEEDHPTRSTDEILNQNLDHMSVSITRLKDLAHGLNTELVTQNDMIERIHDKTEGVNWNVNKQNKEIGKILKK